ncbi:MAG: oligosaccharide flippase family protein [Candidatus Korarchaeota archaeon]|nr:oligosaccharide flippase family protein [Candidatus Korarchaeota archaeon]
MVLAPRDLMRNALGQEGLRLVTAGNMAVVVLGALTWLILAKLLSVNEYGRANFFLSLGVLVASFTGLGLPTTIQTFLPKGEDELVPPAVVLVMITSLAAGIPLAIFHPSLPLIVLSNSLFGLVLKERLGRRKYMSFAILQGVSRLSILVIVLALVPVWGIDAVLYGFSIVYLLLSLRICSEVRGFRNLGALRRHMGFSLMSLLTGAVATMGARLDKVLVGALYGETTLGYYQLAFQFYSAMLVIPSSLGSYLLPEKSSGRRTKLVELMGLGLSALTATAGFFIIPVVIEKLFPRFYPVSSEVAQIAALAIIFDAAFVIWSAGKYSEEDPKAVLLVNSLSLSVFVILILYLGSSMGVVGLAIALLTYRAVASLLGFIEGRVSGRINAQHT